MSMGGGGDKGRAAAEARIEAEDARRREEQRQEALRNARGVIDQGFAMFGDDYVNRYRDLTVQNQLPQVQRQAQEARKNLIYDLQRAGLRNSSVAAEQGGDLERQIALREGETYAAGDDAANALRNRVAESRAAAERDMLAASDTTRVGNDVLARTQILANDTPQPSALGPLFESAALGWNAYNQFQRQRTADGVAAQTAARLSDASRQRG